MKHKKSFVLLSVCTACIALAISGCGSSGNSGSSTSSSAALSAESENTAASTEENGPNASKTITVTSRWYNANQEKLTGASVKVTNSDGESVFTGKTGTDGSLDAFTVPTGTDLTFTITDADGKQLAESKIRYVSSSEYTQILINPVKSGRQTIHLPSDDTNVTAAMFIDNSQCVESTSVTLNRSSENN